MCVGQALDAWDFYTRLGCRTGLLGLEGREDPGGMSWCWNRLDGWELEKSVSLRVVVEVGM